jgi:hypothetical protein
MKILLFAPAFYDYHEGIRDEAVRQGHEVTFHAERPPRWIYSTAKKLPRGLRLRIFDKYLRRVLAQVRAQRFDRILLIRGEIVRPWFVAELRQLNPSARIVLYEWDSLRVVDFSALLPVVDKTLTFDPQDSTELGIDYLPLFYVPAYRIKADSNVASSDMTIVCSYNQDRYETLKTIQSVCLERGISLETYVYIARVDYLKLKWTGKYTPERSSVQFQMLSQKQVVDRYRRATSILDVENNRQAGLTMRTFEALATGRNLVTTNPRTASLLPELADRIVTLDRENIQLSPAALTHIQGDSAALDRYSLENWLKKLLSA